MNDKLRNKLIVMKINVYINDGNMLFITSVKFPSKDFKGICIEYGNIIKYEIR